MYMMFSLFLLSFNYFKFTIHYYHYKVEVILSDKIELVFSNFLFIYLFTRKKHGNILIAIANHVIFGVYAIVSCFKGQMYTLSKNTVPQ